MFSRSPVSERSLRRGDPRLARFEETVDHGRHRRVACTYDNGGVLALYLQIYVYSKIRPRRLDDPRRLGRRSDF